MATGYHDFTAGETLTAANLEDYCEKQSVMVFASAAARNAALAAVLQEGMCAFLQDVNSLTVYSGAAWSTVGPVFGPGTAWTPTLTQSGAVTKTVTYGDYYRSGRVVTAQCRLDVTGAGSAANAITVSLPVTSIIASSQPCGTGWFLDASGSLIYPFVAVMTSTSVVSCFSTQASASQAGLTLGTGTFTAALASGDAIALSITYEAAADA